MQIIPASFPLLSLLVAIPAIAAVLLWLVKPLRPFARTIGLVVSALVLMGSIYAAITFQYAQAGSFQWAETYSWLSTIGVSWALGVNGIGLAMLVLSALLVLIVLVASARDLYPHELERFAPVSARKSSMAVSGDSQEQDTDTVVDSANDRVYDEPGYVALTLAALAFMVLIFTARDVFLFYLAFEAMLVPMYFLIGCYGGGTGRKAAAMKFLLYSLAGGLVMLLGVVSIWAYSPIRLNNPVNPEGLFLIEKLAGQLPLSHGLELFVFITFFFAFAVKAPMVPVHTWLADTTENARPGTSALLVGILDKIGTYGMVVLCLPLFPYASKVSALVIAILAVISVAWGAFAALAQKDLLRLISFTSVSHFGLMVLGIFSGNTLAMTGALVYMVAHGLSIAGMFLTGGFLVERGNSADLSAYGGMQKVTPLLAGGFFISGLAAIALPGLSGFVPELMVLIGTFKVMKWAAVLSLVGVVFGAVYMLWPYQRIFTGPAPKERQSLPDLSVREAWGVVAPLIALMLIMGLHPQPLIEPLNKVSETVQKVVVTSVEAKLKHEISVEGSDK